LNQLGKAVAVVKWMCAGLAGLLFCVSAPRADDRIEFYADAAMSNCMITDVAPSPSFVQIHMFQTGTLPGTDVIFGARIPSCWVGATWLGDFFAIEAIGNSTQSDFGVILLHGACQEPPVYLGYMNFFASGQGLPCCAYPAHPTIDNDIFAVRECGLGFNYRPLLARPAIINGNANCPCEAPLATEETTWGRVKALYH